MISPAEISMIKQVTSGSDNHKAGTIGKKRRNKGHNILLSLLLEDTEMRLNISFC
jgi:hypothetical protein